MNEVVLLGRLTRDPELRQTPSGRAVVDFTLAVDRSFSREEADFIPCTAWQKTAEFIAEYFRKGQQMALSGRIRVEPYTNTEGNKRTRISVVADKVEFAGPKASAADNFARELTELESEGIQLPFD